MKGWSEIRAKELYLKGKIRGYKVNNPHQSPNGKIVAKAFKKKSKEKEWLEANLFYWCNEHALQLKEEYKFCETRKWRADFAILGISVLIEYEGIYSEQSRHTNRQGYSRDTDKYRQAAKQGLILLRYTANNYQQVIKDLDEIWERFLNDKTQS